MFVCILMFFISVFLKFGARGVGDVALFILMNRLTKTESVIFISLFWFSCSQGICFLPAFFYVACYKVAVRHKSCPNYSSETTSATSTKLTGMISRSCAYFQPFTVKMIFDEKIDREMAF